MENLKKIWGIVLIILLLTNCKKEDPTPEPDPIVPKEQASALTQKINTFVKDVMTDVYLWYKEMPTIDIKYELDTKAYFKKLLYKEDKWSYITDNITEFENSLQGTEKTFGYSLAFGRFVDGTGQPTGNLFAIVEYVYPNSPAANQGMKRGDIIIKINNQNITTTNRNDLLNSESMSITTGILTTQGIATGSNLSMTSQTMNLDPVLMYKVIERQGRKIGYLLYIQYITKFNPSLDAAFQTFKNAQITDLIIDLRYNMGGQLDAAQYLCSSIAPLTVTNNSSTLVTFQWNDKYQDYWQSKNRNDQLKISFNPEAKVKLGLNKVYFLTGFYTASASELTITGLRPYMSVVLVGDTTYGKYTGSFTLKPEDVYSKASDYADFKNWGLQPIIFRYANSQGVTDFKNGFAPDYLVFDQLLPAMPFGELTEPLLKKAVENITGSPIAEALKKAVVPAFRYEIFDRGFSKYDMMKQTVIMDKFQLKPEMMH